MCLTVNGTSFIFPPTLKWHTIDFKIVKPMMTIVLAAKVALISDFPNVPSRRLIKIFYLPSALREPKYRCPISSAQSVNWYLRIQMDICNIFDTKKFILILRDKSKRKIFYAPVMTLLGNNIFLSTSLPLLSS